MITKPLLQNIVDISGVEERKLVECSKKLLYLAQNFEKELPGLHNLKTTYIPLLNNFVQQWDWLINPKIELYNFFEMNGPIYMNLLR